MAVFTDDRQVSNEGSLTVACTVSPERCIRCCFEISKSTPQRLKTTQMRRVTSHRAKDETVYLIKPQRQSSFVFHCLLVSQRKPECAL